MKITIISNFFNHHQKYLADELNRNCESFFFIETDRIPQERLALGYQASFQEEYLLSAADDKAAAAVADADVIIIGSAPYDMIKNVKKNKLIFRYSERPFKQEPKLHKAAYRYLKWKREFTGIKRHYLLCAGAFTAQDYARCGLFVNKAYQWGYFPQTETYELDSLMAGKDRRELLWCGRFLNWKHPDDAVAAAAKLRAEGCEFHLTMVGTGAMEEDLRKMISELGLRDSVALAGSMKAEEVRRRMERAGIYLFTSDRREGWGAVLNEAMNSACAVVASDQCGSVPFLAEHDRNALVYPATNRDALAKELKALLQRPDEQERLGREAYDTIVSLWNAQTAAERLIALAERILSGEEEPELYPCGPCSWARQ